MALSRQDRRAETTDAVDGGDGHLLVVPDRRDQLAHSRPDRAAVFVLAIWPLDNYQRVAWDLAEQDGGTELTITGRNLPSDEAAATWEQAWKAALESLKKVLER